MVATPSQAQPPAPREDFADVRLHVVTGKGGTGKTTVAAALAITLASFGRRVLLAEVEGRQGISQTFDVPPLPAQEQLVLRVSGGGEVWGLATHPKAALLEYLRLYYHLGRAGAVLERLGAIDFATTIAPGVRDVLLIGKVYEAVTRRVGSGRGGGAPRDGRQPDAWAYDAVVLDAPPTGRVVQFLNVNDEVADLARIGPVRRHAKWITRLLRSSASAVHLVTLLEEMPVQETIDAIDQLRVAGLPIGALVVNQARDPVLDADTIVALASGSLHAEQVTADLAHADLPADPETVSGLLAQAVAHTERLAAEDTQLATLDGLGLPLLVLPDLPDPDGTHTARKIAQELAEQGHW